GSIDMQADRYISIYGSRGTINVGWHQAKYRPAAGPDWIKFGNGYDKIRAMRAQVANFGAALKGRQALVTTAEDAVAAVAADDVAYRSLDRAGWVAVDSTTLST